MYILYGPCTTMVFSCGDGVHEFAMNQLMEYDLVHENISFAGGARVYAPGGARNKYSPGTELFVQHLEQSGVKLRYSGGFVPDINQVLLKRGGVFSYNFV